MEPATKDLQRITKPGYLQEEIKNSSIPASIQPKLSKLHRQAYYKYTDSFYYKVNEKQYSRVWFLIVL